MENFNPPVKRRRHALQRRRQRIDVALGFHHKKKIIRMLGRRVKKGHSRELCGLQRDVVTNIFIGKVKLRKTHGGPDTVPLLHHIFLPRRRAYHMVDIKFPGEGETHVIIRVRHAEGWNGALSCGEPSQKTHRRGS